MIKANELRIGNWIKHSNDDIFMDEEKGKPVKLGVKDISFISCYPDNKLYEPLHLTPEILIACGFEPCTCKGWKLRKGMGLHLGEDLQFDSYRKIQHLHQLQNLYHSLTGNELDINL